MSNAVWLALGLLGAGCGSTKVLADPFGVDGGVCVGTPGAITSTSLPRHTFGWTFVLASAGTDAGVSGNASAVDGGAAASHCASVTDRVTAVGDPSMTSSCVGGAWLRQTTAGPTLVFDDGSAFTWDGSLLASAAPRVASPSGDRIWADFEATVRSDCPECGLYTWNTLEIRSAAGGTVRFYAQQGSSLPALTDSQIMDLFDATATSVPECTFQVADSSCISFERTEYAHQLATTPPQTIPSGVWTTVDAKTGRYSVLWYASTESTPQVTCTDEPGAGTDNGFVATRLSP